MPVLLCFVDGREIRLDVDPDKWASAFEGALAKGEVIHIKEPSEGGALGINPRLVMYWKAEPDES